MSGNTHASYFSLLLCSTLSLVNWSCIFITGYAEFANATIQVYENESSIEVCVRVRGYGFVVNVSTTELTAIGTLYTHHHLVN